MTFWQSIALSNTDKTSPIKIEDNPQTSELLKKTSKEPQVKRLQMKFVSLNQILATSSDSAYKGLQVVIVVLLIIFVINLFATIFLLLYVISNQQKKLSVLRLLGYRKFDRYRAETLILLGLGLGEVITLICFKASLIPILLAVLMMLADLLVFSLVVQHVEARDLSFLLKGGVIMIELKNITKKFENKTVFANFNLQIDQNEIVAIIGPSGSGKSTLLNILGLIDKVDDGDYQFEQYTNIKPNSRLAQKIIREKISYLFQNFALIEEDTVLQNLLLALKYVKQSKKEKTEIITAALQKVGLSEYLNSKIYELSGGQQQRIAVARAIIKPSELVLADEPTGSLDSKNRDEIIKLLLELNDAGKTVIVVTHDSHVAEKCHRVLELK